MLRSPVCSPIGLLLSTEAKWRGNMSEIAYGKWDFESPREQLILRQQVPICNIAAHWLTSSDGVEAHVVC